MTARPSDGQDGSLEEPEPPFPKQHQEPPGSEKALRPRPRYQAEAYKPAGKLEGRVALITGGDSGIGRAVAVMYAREGADVAIVHLPEEDEDAQETVEAVKDVGRGVLAIAGDVRDEAFCTGAVARALEEFGHVDILVNNAAYQQSRNDLDEVSMEEWDKTFQTNIYGYFRMVKAVVPHMGEGSVIINTGSITGLEGSKRLLDYSTTKGAIHAFTKSLAQLLQDKGIRVNCIAPGPVWSPLNPSDMDAEHVAHFGESTPYGRPAQPEEIAPAYVFFASAPDSGYITGEVLPILGGKTVAG